MFWSLSFSQRRLWFDGHILIESIKHRTPSKNEITRNHSCKYWLPKGFTRIKVCKPMFLSTLGLKSDGMVSAFKKARIESCTDFLTALKDKRGVAGRRRKQEAMAQAAAAASSSSSSQSRPPLPTMPPQPPPHPLSLPGNNMIAVSSTGGVHVPPPPPLTHAYSTHGHVQPSHNAVVSIGNHYMHEMKPQPQQQQQVNSAINLTLLK